MSAIPAALEILPVTSTSAVSQPAAPPWKAGGVLPYMPAQCDVGRAYVNVDELLAGGAADAAEKLAASKFPLGDEGKNWRALMAIFGKAGRNPYRAMKEMAICFEQSDGSGVGAIRIDFTGIERPAEVIAKAIADSRGKPAKVDTTGGFVWLEQHDGLTIAIGDDLVLFGQSRKTVESGASGRGAASDFDDAPRHVVWVRLRDKDALLKLTSIGADLDFQLEMQFGASAASMVSSWQSMLPQLEKMVDDPKLAPFKALLPAARRASLQASGERLTVSTRMPKTIVGEVLQGLVDSPGL